MSSRASRDALPTAVVIGLDLGTQSTKAVVCEARPGLPVLGRGRREHPTRYPAPGHAEQETAWWEAGLAGAIGEALAAARREPAEVAALAITGQLDGLVAVDERGRAQGPCLVWLDRRATGELPPLDDDRFLAITGQVADASHLAAKARWWDRHAPARAAAFHQPVSYLVERLTGARVIDHALASTTMVYDLERADWSEELCAAFALDRARLPRIAAAHDVAGVLTREGAALTGLAAGTPVAVGTGDDFATALGGGLAPGALVAVLGTAEVVGARAAVAVRDRGRLVETHAYPAGGFFVENPGWLAGGAVAWLAGLTGRTIEELDLAAAAAPVGAGGVAFLPALGGAMTPVWDPAARGAFAGLAPGHDAGHLARALYEACAFAMRDVSLRLAELGVSVDRVRLLGGGARSRVWAQIKADVAGVPVEIAGDVDGAPLGAAMLALTAAGLVPDLVTAAGWAPPPSATIEPIAAHGAAMDDGHARSRRLYRALGALDGSRDDAR